MKRDLGMGVLGKLLGLRTFEIREKDEAVVVEPFEQHEAHGGPTSVVGGRQRTTAHLERLSPGSAFIFAGKTRDGIVGRRHERPFCKWV